MPRSRSIKPGTFDNELLGEADPIYTLLFIGLWTLADREGRLEDRPKRIGKNLMGYRDTPEITGLLDTLMQMGFIDRYTVDGIAIIQIVNFSKHQNPHRNEKESELPERPINKGSQDSSRNDPTKSVQAPPESERLGLTPDSLNLTPDKGLLTPDNPITGPAPKKTGAKRKRSVVALPDWLDRKLWDDYVASRRSMKKHPMSISALEITVAAIEKAYLSGIPPDTIMRAMIANGWRGCNPRWFAEQPTHDETPEQRAERWASNIESEHAEVITHAQN